MRNLHNQRTLEALRGNGNAFDKRTITMLGKQFPWVRYPLPKRWMQRIIESDKDIVVPDGWGDTYDEETEFMGKIDAILDAVNRIEKRVMQEAENPDNVIEQIKRKVEALIPTTGMTLVEASVHVNALYAVLDIIKEYESPIN